MKVYEEHSSEKFPKFLTGFGSLPIVSKYAQKAIRMMSDETDVDFTTISKIIDRDPGIASRIVIMANSVAYQASTRSKKVFTTKEALIRIGITGAKTIILTESIYDFIKGDDNTDIVARHSFHTASLARMISIQSKSCDQEEAFSIGLLHDIGFIAFCIFNRMQNNKTPSFRKLSDERDYYGITHAETGKRLLKMWDFDEIYLSAINAHHIHSNHTYELPIVSVLKLADLISCEFYKSTDMEMPESEKQKLLNNALSNLRLTLPDIERIKTEYLNGQKDSDD